MLRLGILEMLTPDEFLGRCDVSGLSEEPALFDACGAELSLKKSRRLLRGLAGGRLVRGQLRLHLRLDDGIHIETD